MPTNSAPQYGWSRLLAEKEIRLDKRLGPRDADAPIADRFDAIEVAVPRVAERPELIILHHLRGEDQVVRRERRAVMPAGASPDGPLELHSPIWEDLPEAILQRWDALAKLGPDLTPVVEVGQAGVHELFDGVAAGDALNELVVEDVGRPANRDGDPLRRCGCLRLGARLDPRRRRRRAGDDEQEEPRQPGSRKVNHSAGEDLRMLCASACMQVAAPGRVMSYVWPRSKASFSTW